MGIALRGAYLQDGRKGLKYMIFRIIEGAGIWTVLAILLAGAWHRMRNSQPEVLGRNGAVREILARSEPWPHRARCGVLPTGDQHDAYLAGLRQVPRPSPETVREVAKRYLDRMERERGGDDAECGR
jgi:hypothetical protein